MTTPLPLPERPSCKLTWIEYSPFFMRPQLRPPFWRGSVFCYAKTGHAASTRQMSCRPLQPCGVTGRAIFVQTVPVIHSPKGGATAVPGRFSSGVLLVAFQEFNGEALRPANKANAHARPAGGRLLGEFDALGLDLGGHRVDVLYRQSEMFEPLVRRYWRRMDAVTRIYRCDEHIGAAELDVDTPGAADDLAAENIFEPGSHCLRIGTAQMNMVPGHCRHRWCLHLAVRRRRSRRFGLNATFRSRSQF